MHSLPTVLVLDTEPSSVVSIARILGEQFQVFTATCAQDARELLQREWIQVFICDQVMPDISGIAFLSEVQESWPDVICMIISDFSESPDIVATINAAGIYNFIKKPWEPSDLVLKVKNATDLYMLQRHSEQLSIELKLKPHTLDQTISEKRALVRARFDPDMGIVRAPDSPMNQVCELIAHVAPFDVNVLLSGESGTGKELCARALHYNSLRREAPFIAENCAALPDDLLESELFGHKRGAFTGAVDDRVGLFELADGGTIFLDEIGDISPAFQVKLLRVLQEQEIRPLGSDKRHRVDVRVIAATNRVLEEDVKAGRFRQDLYYRLATFTVGLPPLRERPGDIAPLAYSILEEAMETLGKRVSGFSQEAIDCMQRYNWPGNVRELQNETKRMLVMAHDSVLDSDLLSARVLLAAPQEQQPDLKLVSTVDGSLKDRVEAMEATILKETLIRHRWNKTQAARELGLSRVGLRNKLERYELEQVK